MEGGEGVEDGMKEGELFRRRHKRSKAAVAFPDVWSGRRLDGRQGWECSVLQDGVVDLVDVLRHLRSSALQGKL